MELSLSSAIGGLGQHASVSFNLIIIELTPRQRQIGLTNAIERALQKLVIQLVNWL